LVVVGECDSETVVCTGDRSKACGASFGDPPVRNCGCDRDGRILWKSCCSLVVMVLMVVAMVSLWKLLLKFTSWFD
jgi:hypothetical protein